MENKPETRIKLSNIFLIISIIIIGVMASFMFKMNKKIEDLSLNNIDNLNITQNSEENNEGIQNNNKEANIKGYTYKTKNKDVCICFYEDTCEMKWINSDSQRFLTGRYFAINDETICCIFTEYNVVSNGDTDTYKAINTIGCAFKYSKENEKDILKVIDEIEGSFAFELNTQQRYDKEYVNLDLNTGDLLEGAFGVPT